METVTWPLPSVFRSKSSFFRSRSRKQLGRHFDGDARGWGAWHVTDPGLGKQGGAEGRVQALGRCTPLSSTACPHCSSSPFQKKPAAGRGPRV